MTKPKKVQKVARRGQHPWHPTDEQRNQVLLLRATGMSASAIASVLGVGEGTLRFRCNDELNFLYHKKKFEVIGLLEKSAKKGNVAAQKALLSLIEKQELAVYGYNKPAKSAVVPEKEPKEEKLGKNEGLNLEAKTAHKGTTWADKLQ